MDTDLSAREEDQGQDDRSNCEPEEDLPHRILQWFPINLHF
jgi:hypothetical protein